MIRLMNEDSFEQAWLAAGRLPDMAEHKMKELKKLLDQLKKAKKAMQEPGVMFSDPVIEKMDAYDEDSYQPYIILYAADGTEIVIEYVVQYDEPVGGYYNVVLGDESQKAKTVSEAVDAVIYFAADVYGEEFQDEPYDAYDSDYYGYDNGDWGYDDPHGRYGGVGAVW